MKGPVVYLASICPECKGRSVMPYTRLEIAELLLSNRPFVLYSACHAISWEATEEDRRQMFALIKPIDESERRRAVLSTSTSASASPAT